MFCHNTYYTAVWAVGWTAPRLALGPTKPPTQFVPQTLVTNYQSKLRNIAEELRIFTPQRKPEITYELSYPVRESNDDSLVMQPVA
jgi:hypothetical protein